MKTFPKKGKNVYLFCFVCFFLFWTVTYSNQLCFSMVNKISIFLFYSVFHIVSPNGVLRDLVDTISSVCLFFFFPSNRWLAATKFSLKPWSTVSPHALSNPSNLLSHTAHKAASPAELLRKEVMLGQSIRLKAASMQIATHMWYIKI